MDAPLVRVRDLVKVYDRGRSVQALRGIHLDVAAGEAVALMGPSGSGKTTLLNILGCLDTATSGHAVVAGSDLMSLDEHGRTRLRRTTIGSVFQLAHLMPTLTAAANVGLPLRLRGMRASEIPAQVERALDDVGLLARKDHLPDELSGGERQRVAVARALVIMPALILADEPTGNLDSVTGAQVLTLFRAVTRSRGTALLLVTHDPGAATWCDRVVRIRDGRNDPPVLEAS